MQEAYIFDAVRTPRDYRKEGNPYDEIKPVDLLVLLLKALQMRNQIDTAQVDDVLIGAVLPLEDYGINIARAGILKAGWPAGVSGMTLNRNAAYGLSAINFAATKVQGGVDGLVIAGGLDSRSRDSYRGQETDFAGDPEWLHLTRYIPASLAADLLATMHGIGREEADRFARHSVTKATAALESGAFNHAVVPLHDRNGLPLLSCDQLRRYLLEEGTLPGFTPFHQYLPSPGFGEIALAQFPEVERIQPVHTEGNSAPSIDGAALALLGSLEKGLALGLTPRARIRAMSHSCTDPVLIYQGAVQAARKCLMLAGMEAGEVEIWQTNEPFAAAPLYFQRELDIPEDRFNIHGGAIALGNAIGASGAILIGMLLEQLEQTGKQTGLAAITAEGGIGVATLIERL
jgi:acetyl-CoA C-acetyltransferase